jgi:dGTP triphosphohydrolase
MKNKNDQKIFLLTTITVILFVALIIWALFVNLKDNNSTDENPQNTENSIDGEVVELITVEDPKIIEINSTKYLLPENYTVVTAALSKPGDFYNCGDADDSLNCRVFYVSDGIDTFYLSSNDYINFDTTKTSLSGAVSISFLGKEVRLMTDELEVYAETAEEISNTSSTKLIKQIYGCTDNICFNSGIITLQEPVNTETENKFKDFLSKITVN